MHRGNRARVLKARRVRKVPRKKEAPRNVVMYGHGGHRPVVPLRCAVFPRDMWGTG